MLKEDWKQFYHCIDDGNEQKFPKVAIEVEREELTLMSIFEQRTCDNKVEDNIISQCDSFITAISCVFANYYIFNLAYPKCLKSTLFFMQKEFANIHDKSEHNQKVLSLIVKLKS